MKNTENGESRYCKTVSIASKSVNKNFRHLLILIMVVIFSLPFFMFACSPQGDFYNYEFTPDTATKQTNESFNIFSLPHQTNLPENIENSLPIYKNVSIAIENSSLIEISSINTITPKNVGSTKVEVTIIYDNQNIIADFNLIIKETSPSEDNKETNNPNDNKPTDPDESENKPTPPEEKDFVFTYGSIDYYEDDKLVVLYSLYIEPKEEYINVKFKILHNYSKEQLMCESAGRNSWDITTIGLKEIIIEILNTKTNNVVRIILMPNN